MPFWSWSKTASTNATADATVNWAEGQSPSSINDSARAMMARLAEYRDDASGGLVTTGTASAYVLATNQGIASSPQFGQVLAFFVHATNNANATLSVDGGPAAPIVINTAGPIPAGTLIILTPYTVVYDGTHWCLRDFYGQPFSVPLGALMPFTGTVSPNSNFIFPAAQSISRTIYSEYFSMVGTTYGAGDGSTSFNVPDLRGRAIFGQDNMNSSPAGRIGTVATDSGTIDGSTLGSGGGSSTHVQTVAELAAHTHTGTTAGQSADHTHAVPLYGPSVTGAGGGGGVMGNGSDTTTRGASNDHTHSFTTNSSGSSAAMSLLPPGIILNYILRIF